MFQLDYEAEIYRHSHYSRYDRVDHQVKGSLDFKFPWRWELKLTDKFVKSATLPGFLGDTLDEYYYNDAKIEAIYKLADRYKLKLAYRNVYKCFPGWTELDNFVRNEGSIALYYRILPKTHFLGQYTFFYIDNEDKGYPSTDNANHLLWLGLEWAPGARIKGGIKGGYWARRYEEAGRDEDTFGVKGDLTYFLGNFTTLQLEAIREIIATEITAEEAYYGTHYIRTGGALSLKYKFPFWTGGYHEVNAILKGFYYNDDYREKGIFTKRRRDVRYGGGIEMNCKFWDRVGIILNYRYRENDSNFDAEDYKENRFMAQISLML